MNGFYKTMNLQLLLADIFIACGIVSSAVFAKVKLMMSLAFLGRWSLIVWCLLFALFLLALILYRHKRLSFRLFAFSALVMAVTCYLTYLCQFTHTPDVFTREDFVWSTKRFFLHIPMEFYWAILQGISYVLGVIVKDSKKLSGLKVNAAFSLFRLFLLLTALIPFAPFIKEDIQNRSYFLIQRFVIIFAVYFIISCTIEFAIDFAIKKCRERTSAD